MSSAAGASVSRGSGIVRLGARERLGSGQAASFLGPLTPIVFPEQETPLRFTECRIPATNAALTSAESYHV